MEAMYSGCVVFSCDTHGATGFIREGVNGYFFSSLDQLKEKLKDYDPAVGVRAQEFVQTYYMDDVVEDEIVETFTRMEQVLS